MVKIVPGYHGPVIWVPDASRSVSVCSNLLSDELRHDYLAEVRAEYARIKTQHDNKKGPGPHKLADARKHGFKPLERLQAAGAVVPGVKQLKNYDLAEIAEHIDWAPFFQTWELAGSYRSILDDEIVVEGAQRARGRQADAKKVIDGRWLTANAAFGFSGQRE